MPVGLNNQGNTCYMDASLQLIVNSTHIRECIMKNNGKFARALQEIINSRGSMTPYTIKSVMGQYYNRFAGFAQQDSHEFISLCLQHLSDEEQPREKYYEEIKYDGLSLQQGYECFKGYCERIQNTSYLRNTRFYVIRELFCKRCNERKSYAFQEGDMLLSIRDASQQLDDTFMVGQAHPTCYGQYFRYSCHEQDLTLGQLLDRQFDEEDMGCKCERCGSSVFGKTSLWSLPRQLIITFARFSGRFQKLNNRIEYSRSIDLNKYLHPESPYSGDHSYQLEAVSLHAGSCGGGHYTAYVIQDNVEYECNDSYVRRTDIDYKDSRAYVLSYRIVEEMQARCAAKTSSMTVGAQKHEQQPKPQDNGKISNIPYVSANGRIPQGESAPQRAADREVQGVLQLEPQNCQADGALADVNENIRMCNPENGLAQPIDILGDRNQDWLGCNDDIPQLLQNNEQYEVQAAKITEQPQKEQKYQ